MCEVMTQSNDIFSYKRNVTVQNLAFGVHSFKLYFFLILFVEKKRQLLEYCVKQSIMIQLTLCPPQLINR